MAEILGQSPNRDLIVIFDITADERAEFDENAAEVVVDEAEKETTDKNESFAPPIIAQLYIFAECQDSDAAANWFDTNIPMLARVANDLFHSAMWDDLSSEERDIAFDMAAEEFAQVIEEKSGYKTKCLVAEQLFEREEEEAGEWRLIRPVPNKSDALATSLCFESEFDGERYYYLIVLERDGDEEEIRDAIRAIEDDLWEIIAPFSDDGHIVEDISKMEKINRETVRNEVDKICAEMLKMEEELAMCIEQNTEQDFIFSQPDLMFDLIILKDGLPDEQHTGNTNPSAANTI